MIFFFSHQKCHDILLLFAVVMELCQVKSKKKKKTKIRIKNLYFHFMIVVDALSISSLNLVNHSDFIIIRFCPANQPTNQNNLLRYSIAYWNIDGLYTYSTLIRRRKKEKRNPWYTWVNDMRYGWHSSLLNSKFIIHAKMLWNSFAINDIWQCVIHFKKGQIFW